MGKPILPSNADIVISGGGVHGASLAFHLAEAKAGRIVLLEKRHLASGPTSRTGAMVRSLIAQTVYVQLVSQSTRMFESCRDEVGGESDSVQNGFLRITSSLDETVIGGDLELTGNVASRMRSSRRRTFLALRRQEPSTAKSYRHSVSQGR